MKINSIILIIEALIIIFGYNSIIAPLQRGFSLLSAYQKKPSPPTGEGYSILSMILRTFSAGSLIFI